MLSDAKRPLEMWISPYLAMAFADERRNLWMGRDESFAVLVKNNFLVFWFQDLIRFQETRSKQIWFEHHWISLLLFNIFPYFATFGVWFVFA
jgi:hypothetical protein